MKRKFAFLIALTFLITVPLVWADGPPNPPCLFWGYVYVGGAPAPDGLNITAAIGGTTVAWTQTGNGTYGWPVMGSSTDTNGFQVPGGSTGDSVTFYVQGVKNAQTGYYEIAGAKRLDLSVPEISGISGSRQNSTLTATLDQTVYAGDKVDVTGRLACANGTGIGSASLSVACMTLPGTTWNTVASPTTEANGFYITQWTPSVPTDESVNYLVKVSWIGSTDVEGAEANLAMALAPVEDVLVISVVSNSSVTDLVYNSTLRVLNFNVTGPDGTTGFTDVAMPKQLVANITGLTVYIDQENIGYTNTSNPTSWTLHLTYTHSAHNVTINLPAKQSSNSAMFLETPPGILTLVVAIGFAAAAGIYLARNRLRQPDPKPKQLPPKRGRQKR
jgi:hypothetical protein